MFFYRRLSFVSLPLFPNDFYSPKKTDEDATHRRRSAANESHDLAKKEHRGSGGRRFFGLQMLNDDDRRTAREFVHAGYETSRGGGRRDGWR